MDNGPFLFIHTIDLTGSLYICYVTYAIKHCFFTLFLRTYVTSMILKPVHKKVFDAIAKFVAKNIYAPTVTEVVELSGAGASTVAKALSELIAAGYLSKTKEQRSLKIERSIYPDEHLTNV